MVDTSLKTHSKYSNFLTPKECEEIISIINRYKDTVPQLGEDETGYSGLTSGYMHYNWLNNTEIGKYNIEKRLFNLPELKDWEYLILQCRCNELHVGDNLDIHYHDTSLDNEIFRRRTFYSANIFLSGEFNETWYEDIGYVNNEVGDIHIFPSNLDHEVYPNTGNDTRYSMAIDIHPSWLRGGDKMTNLHRWRVVKNA